MRAEFATSYKAHVLDSAGKPVQSGDTSLVVALTASGGTGTKTDSLDSAELGNPTGAATFKFKVGRRCLAYYQGKNGVCVALQHAARQVQALATAAVTPACTLYLQVESTNSNNVGTGALSAETDLVIFGKLATPAAPELEWFNQADSNPAHVELRFEAITAPAGSNPIYEYQLYNATTGTAVGSWQAIDFDQVTGGGSPDNKYKVRLAPSPGKYTAKIRATTALGASATSDASLASAAEVMGEFCACCC